MHRDTDSSPLEQSAKQTPWALERKQANKAPSGHCWGLYLVLDVRAAGG